MFRLLVNREKTGEESFIQKKLEEAKQKYSHVSSNANVINIDIRMGTRVGIDGEEKQGIVRWVTDLSNLGNSQKHQKLIFFLFAIQFCWYK